MKIAILMLTYNAPRYVLKSIVSLSKTKNNPPYELIVVDNASRWKTKFLLRVLKAIKKIDVLHFNNYNALFARGNNIASYLTSKDVTHYLLLNSDVEIKDSRWLEKLSALHTSEGITSLGFVDSELPRADGYCMLVDKWIYEKYHLDEEFEWWWSVTKLQSLVLKEGLQIRAVADHEKLLHHYGGASGKGWADAKGIDIDVKEAMKWFEDKKTEVTIIDTIS